MSVYMRIKTEFHAAVAKHRNELPCRKGNPDDWFALPGSKRASQAKQACMACPIFWTCQDYAFRAGVPSGIWGGVDEKARDRAWRSSPAGKPTHFIEEMDAALLPMLQARRDHENFDAQHPQDEEDAA